MSHSSSNTPQEDLPIPIHVDTQPDEKSMHEDVHPLPRDPCFPNVGLRICCRRPRPFRPPARPPARSIDRTTMQRRFGFTQQHTASQICSETEIPTFFSAPCPSPARRFRSRNNLEGRDGEMRTRKVGSKK